MEVFTCASSPPTAPIPQCKQIFAARGLLEFPGVEFYPALEKGLQIFESLMPDGPTGPGLLQMIHERANATEGCPLLVDIPVSGCMSVTLKARVISKRSIRPRSIGL